jgi:hypothetical protein
MFKMQYRFVVALATALTSIFAPPAVADTKLPGISFDIMPVGCRIHGKYSSGDRVIDEYIGKTGSRHVVKTFSGSKGTSLVRTTTYNADGFMIRKDWADGKWETFAPYSCFDVPGNCKYRYRNADGQESQFKGKVYRRGTKVVSTGGFVGENPFPKSIVTIGPFNNGDKWTDGSTSFAVTKYENCGDVGVGS